MSQEIYVKPKKVTPLNILLILIGSSLYALSVNFFLVPLKLYSGGVPGTAQMLRTLFFSNVQNVDTAGIINLAFNIPLFLLALKKMKQKKQKEFNIFQVSMKLEKLLDMLLQLQNQVMVET